MYFYFFNFLDPPIVDNDMWMNREFGLYLNYASTSKYVLYYWNTLCDIYPACPTTGYPVDRFFLGSQSDFQKGYPTLEGPFS